jgi:hypothetical protein
LNFFTVEKAKKSAKNATDSGGSHKDLATMPDGEGAGGMKGKFLGKADKSGNRWW